MSLSFDTIGETVGFGVLGAGFALLAIGIHSVTLVQAVVGLSLSGMGLFLIVAFRSDES